jgi:predicted nucleic acid-binding protein
VPRTVLYDACVLYPAPLRDLLMHLALTSLYRATWTDAIHEEWLCSLLKVRPNLTREQLERTRRLMNQHALDALITGYEHLIPSLELPDPDDRHVLAAAIHGKAEVIVTYNLSDFPVDTLARYGIEAQHPDEFITSLLDLDPGAVVEAVRRQRQSLRHPPKTADELLAIFAKQHLAETVRILRPYAESF